MTKTTELPIGWKELRVKSPHPMDVGTAEEEWDKTAHPRYPRVEKVCWIRGNRYVRICEAFNHEKESLGFTVHYGKLDDSDSDKMSWYDEPDFAKIEKESRILMRIGGMPK